LTKEVAGADLPDIEDELHVNAVWLTASSAVGDATATGLDDGVLDAALGLVTTPAGNAPVG
jgi:hypothetical protein